MDSTILNSNSNRGKQWIAFAEKVLKHIDGYTVPQYGDFPNDACAGFSGEKIVSSIERYCKRFGKNSREGQDFLDLMKIAHYACILQDKIGEQKEEIKFEIDGGGIYLSNWIDENLRGDGNDYKCVITKIGSFPAEK